MDIFSVQLSKKAEKDLNKVPLYISEKLQIWIDLIENEGLRAARKIKSFHDEPLKGNRASQRSVRLNKALNLLRCWR